MANPVFWRTSFGVTKQLKIPQPSTARLLPRPQWSGYKECLGARRTLATHKSPDKVITAATQYGPGSSTVAAFLEPYAGQKETKLVDRAEPEDEKKLSQMPEEYQHLLNVDPATREIIYNMRLPRSVQAVYLNPLRRQPEFGLAVCDLQLRSYSVRNLEFFADFAMRAAYYLGLPARGPVPLPRLTESWTVPRSNFIHKKSQENFRRTTLRRLIQIQDGHPEVVQCWLGYLEKRAYHGIGMKANVWEFEELDVARKMDERAKIADKHMEEHWSNFGMRANAATEENMKKILGDQAFSKRPRPMEDYIRDPIEIRRS